MSYSQFDEEKWILEAFRGSGLLGDHMPIACGGTRCDWCGKFADQWTADDVCPGKGRARFLDIGAWHPIDKSNTRALFERGWGGVLIEPSPRPVQNLVREYGDCDRIKVIAAAIGITPGIVELAITDDALSAPADYEPHMKLWKQTGGFYGKLTVPVISVEQLFAQFGGAFEMVSIDTEGTSVEICIEMWRIGPRPRCVVIEHDNRIVELSQYAEEAHYRLLHLNATNAVFEWRGRRE